VIDPVTRRATTFTLGAPTERILLYQGASPADPRKRPRALLIGPGNGQIGFLDLDGLEDLRGRDFEPRTMAGQASAFVPLLDRGLLVALHNGGGPSGNVGLSVIDLDHRTIAPLVSESLTAILPGGPDELWLQPQAGFRVGRLGLTQLQAQEVRLDRPVTRILPLVASASGQRFVVIEHPEDGGAITVLDADKPERKTARALAGFLYTDLLEGGRR
jgi:hypothetical protein